MSTPLPTLEAYFSQVDFATKYEEIVGTLSGCQAEFTFWGTRLLRSRDNNETAELELVAKKILQSISACDASSCPDVKERLARLQMNDQICAFYASGDKQLAEKSDLLSLMTRIIVWVREFLFISPRMLFEDRSFVDRRWLSYKKSDYNARIGNKEFQRDYPSKKVLTVLDDETVLVDRKDLENFSAWAYAN